MGSDGRHSLIGTDADIPRPGVGDAPMNGKLWISLVLVTAISLAMGFVSVFAAQVEADRQAQKFCTVIVLLDDAYQTPPGPQTVVGKQFAAAVHQYRLDLHCKEAKK